MTAQREWFEKDFYDVLGVPEDASEKQVTKAYRKLARELHPDANPGDDAAEERFKEVSAAYDVLGDTDKRKEYDEVRRLGPMAGGFGGAPGGGGFRFDTEDLGDLFGNLFGGTGRRSRGGAQRAERGVDLETDLRLSFRDAVHGVTTSVHLVGDARCSTCHGSGAKPGTSPTTCDACGGAGVLNDNQGLFSFSRPCPSCGGAGQVVESPCGACRGSGRERRGRDVKVRIPAGVENGSRIRVPGRGGPGLRGGQPGDLFVRVAVAPDEIFGRKGPHLTLVAPVSFAEAALGADIKVPTLDGEPVRLRIPPSTPSGKRFRVKGRGVHAKRGTGDLLVTVEVAVPTELSGEARAAIEAYAAADGSDLRGHLGV